MSSAGSTNWGSRRRPGPTVARWSDPGPGWTREPRRAAPRAVRGSARRARRMTGLLTGRLTGPRRVVGSLFAAAFLVAAGALLPAGLPGAAPPVAAASGLTTTADARYVVDPGKHAVHVTVALSATNHLKDTKTHRY